MDRSPEYFEPLLNFLRHGKLILNEGINPQGNNINCAMYLLYRFVFCAVAIANMQLS